MFWIHGGGFSAGSGSKEIYGPDHLVDKNVILVTINYRLGPLGFLCLHTPEVPGNAGLKDQVMALRWVNDNIKQFGGNPDNITIFGESAGASSVHFHLLSSLAKGLFTKAILQSGTSINEWAIQPNPIGTALKLGELLQFKTDNKEELYKFLLEVDVKALMEISAVATELMADNGIAFSPVVENIYPNSQTFISELPRELLKAGKLNKVPTITGINSNEGVLLAMKFGDTDVSTLKLEQIIPDFGEYIPKDLRPKLNAETTKIITKKIKDYYFAEEEKVMENFYNFMSDFLFVKDIHFFAKLLSKNEHTYYYRFSYKGSLNVMKLLWGVEYNGAAHADELGYLFKATLPTSVHVEVNETDINMIKQMTEMWTNFAKTRYEINSILNSNSKVFYCTKYTHIKR